MLFIYIIYTYFNICFYSYHCNILVSALSYKNNWFFFIPLCALKTLNRIGIPEIYFINKFVLVTFYGTRFSDRLFQSYWFIQILFFFIIQLWQFTFSLKWKRFSNVLTVNYTQNSLIICKSPLKVYFSFLWNSTSSLFPCYNLLENCHCFFSFCQFSFYKNF